MMKIITAMVVIVTILELRPTIRPKVNPIFTLNYTLNSMKGRSTQTIQFYFWKSFQRVKYRIILRVFDCEYVPGYDHRTNYAIVRRRGKGG